MKIRRASARFTAILAAVYFVTNCAFAHQAETSVWAGRRKSMPAAVEKPVLWADAGGPEAFEPKLSAIVSPSLTPSLKKQLGQLPKDSLRTYESLVTALPQTFGSVRKISRPSSTTSKRIVIHIQDVHLNQEAQKNIGQTIQELTTRKKIGLVALEGAFAPIDLAPLRAFPRHEAVRKVADYLFRENKISGPVRAALVSPTEVPPFVGVDDPLHYRANVNAYRRAAPRVKDVVEMLSAQENRLSLQKRKAFRPALATFDAVVESHRKGKLAMGPYIQTLAQQAPTTSFTVDTFLEAFKMESAIRFNDVEAERSRVIAKLLSKLDKSKTSELLNTSLSFRFGQLQPADFYAYLKDLCETSGVRLDRYPAMSAYLRYVLLAEGIDGDRLFKDVARMEEEGYAALARTEAERKLIGASRHLFLVGKLINFSLTREEWNAYLNYKSQITKLKITMTVQPLDLKNFESFYEEAEARDRAMAENLLKRINAANANVSVLVTGGFHSSGIGQRLNDAGVTTITYVPKITKVDSENGSAYLSVFSQEKTPLDKLFEGEKLFLASQPMIEREAALTLSRLADEWERPADKIKTTRLSPKALLEMFFDTRGEVDHVLVEPTPGASALWEKIDLKDLFRIGQWETRIISPVLGLIYLSSPNAFIFSGALSLLTIFIFAVHFRFGVMRKDTDGKGVPGARYQWSESFRATLTAMSSYGVLLFFIPIFFVDNPILKIRLITGLSVLGGETFGFIHGALNDRKDARTFVAWLTEPIRMWTAVRCSRRARDAIAELSTTQDERLVGWYVGAMRRFGPQTDRGKKIVLEWISRQLEKAASADPKKGASVIRHFFYPVTLKEANLLLPRYRPVLEHPEAEFDKSVLKFDGNDKLAFARAILLRLIAENKDKKKPIKILLAGGAGGGKSTLAKDLAGAAVQIKRRLKTVGMDAYTFSRAERAKQKLEGLRMYEWDKVNAMTDALAEGRPFHARQTDRAAGESFDEPEATDPTAIDFYLFEGILTLASPELRSKFDVGLYLDENDEQRFHHRLQRDQKEKKYSPLHIAWTFATTQLDEFHQIQESAPHATYILNYQDRRLYRIRNGQTDATGETPVGPAPAPKKDPGDVESPPPSAASEQTTPEAPASPPVSPEKKGYFWEIFYPLANLYSMLVNPIWINLKKSPDPLFTKEEFAGAYDALQGATTETPLVKLRLLSMLTGKDVYLKDESKQEGGSFKARGVYYEVLTAIEKAIEKARETAEGRAHLNEGLKIVTQSTGNHGIALIRSVTRIIQVLSEKHKENAALVAALRKIEPVVFTFKNLAPEKRRDMERALREYQAAYQTSQGRLIDDFEDYDVALKAREKFIHDHAGAALYMDHSGRDIMLGHGSAGIEIAKQLAEMGVPESKKVALIIPVGAGGPIGIAAALKAYRQNVSAVMVQSNRWDAFVKTLQTGRLHKNPKNIPPTFALRTDKGDVELTFPDGIAVDGPEGEAIKYAKNYLDAAISVDEKSAFETSAPLLWDDLNSFYKNSEDVRVGGTTALTVEALLSAKAVVPSVKDADVVVLFGTEGNVSQLVLDYLRTQRLTPERLLRATALWAKPFAWTDVSPANIFFNSLALIEASYNRWIKKADQPPARWSRHSTVRAFALLTLAGEIAFVLWGNHLFASPCVSWETWIKAIFIADALIAALANLILGSLSGRGTSFAQALAIVLYFFLPPSFAIALHVGMDAFILFALPRIQSVSLMSDAAIMKAKDARELFKGVISFPLLLASVTLMATLVHDYVWPWIDAPGRDHSAWFRTGVPGWLIGIGYGLAAAGVAVHQGLTVLVGRATASRCKNLIRRVEEISGTADTMAALRQQLDALKETLDDNLRASLSEARGAADAWLPAQSVPRVYGEKIVLALKIIAARRIVLDYLGTHGGRPSYWTVAFATAGHASLLNMPYIAQALANAKTEASRQWREAKAAAIVADAYYGGTYDRAVYVDNIAIFRRALYPALSADGVTPPSFNVPKPPNELHFTPRWAAWSGVAVGAIGALWFFTGLIFNQPLALHVMSAWIFIVGLLFYRHAYGVTLSLQPGLREKSFHHRLRAPFSDGTAAGSPETSVRPELRERLSVWDRLGIRFHEAVHNIHPALSRLPENATPWSRFWREAAVNALQAVALIMVIPLPPILFIFNPAFQKNAIQVVAAFFKRGPALVFIFPLLLFVSFGFLFEGTPPILARADAPISQTLRGDARRWLEEMMPPGWKQFEMVPGMGFKDVTTWWGNHGRRSSPLFYHSGTDFARGLTASGQSEPIPEGTKVRSMTDGVIMAVVEDEMQTTIFVKTNIFDSKGNRLVFHYTHIALPADKTFAPGDVVLKGDLLGTIERSRNEKAIVAPHLHLSTAWMSESAVARVVDVINTWKKGPKKEVFWADVDLLVAKEKIISYFDPMDLFHANERQKFRFVDYLKEIVRIVIVHPGKTPPIYEIKRSLARAYPGIMFVDVRGQIRERADAQGQSGMLPWEEELVQTLTLSGHAFITAIATQDDVFRALVNFSDHNQLGWDVIRYESEDKLLPQLRPIVSYYFNRQKESDALAAAKSRPVAVPQNGNGMPALSHPSISLVPGLFYWAAGFIRVPALRKIVKGFIAVGVAPGWESLGFAYSYFWSTGVSTMPFVFLVAAFAAGSGFLFAAAHILVFDNNSPQPRWITPREFLAFWIEGIFYALVFSGVASLLHLSAEREEDWLPALLAIALPHALKNIFVITRRQEKISDGAHRQEANNVARLAVALAGKDFQTALEILVRTDSEGLGSPRSSVGRPALRDLLVREDFQRLVGEELRLLHEQESRTFVWADLEESLAQLISAALYDANADLARDQAFVFKGAAPTIEEEAALRRRLLLARWRLGLNRRAEIIVPAGQEKIYEELTKGLSGVTVKPYQPELPFGEVVAAYHLMDKTIVASGWDLNDPRILSLDDVVPPIVNLSLSDGRILAILRGIKAAA